MKTIALILLLVAFVARATLVNMDVLTNVTAGQTIQIGNITNFVTPIQTWGLTNVTAANLYCVQLVTNGGPFIVQVGWWADTNTVVYQQVKTITAAKVDQLIALAVSKGIVPTLPVGSSNLVCANIMNRQTALEPALFISTSIQTNTP